MNYFILFGSSRIGFQCFLQYKQGAVQVIFLQYVCDTHFVATGTRRSIESGRRRHEYRLSLVLELRQTPGTELVRIIYRKLCHRIEGSHRDGRIYARYTVQSVNQAFTAFYIFIVCVAQIILIGIQRWPINGGLRRAWQNFMTASLISLFFVIRAPMRMPHSE